MMMQIRRVATTMPTARPAVAPVDLVRLMREVKEGLLRAVSGTGDIFWKVFLECLCLIR